MPLKRKTDVEACLVCILSHLFEELPFIYFGGGGLRAVGRVFFETELGMLAFSAVSVVLAFSAVSVVKRPDGGGGLRAGACIF